MDFPEYVKKLKEGQRYIILIGKEEYYMGFVPTQFTGIFSGIDGDSLYFTDIKRHHVPYSNRALPTFPKKNEKTVKIPLERIIEEELLLPVHPKSKKPIEVDLEEGLDNNRYVIEISEKQLIVRKRNISELIKKLEKGKTYLLTATLTTDLHGYIPHQLVGTYFKKEGDELYFKDCKIGAMPDIFGLYPAYGSEIIKFSLKDIEEKEHYLPIDPKTRNFIEVDNPADIKLNEYVMKLSSERHPYKL